MASRFCFLVEGAERISALECKCVECIEKWPCLVADCSAHSEKSWSMRLPKFENPTSSTALCFHHGANVVDASYVGCMSALGPYSNLTFEGCGCPIDVVANRDGTIRHQSVAYRQNGGSVSVCLLDSKQSG